ncbi:hypothetical protein V8D89_012581 [Ganoderma adspersum]
MRGDNVLEVQRSLPPVSDTSQTPQPFQQFPDEEGVKCLEPNFREEPLGVAWKHGFGYYNAQFGEVTGAVDGSAKYRIERKLGWGTSSSVWLAKDLQKDRFVALKILTSYHTHWHHKGACIEVDALALLMGHPNIIQPFHDFTIPAKRRRDRRKEEHIVIATQLYGGSLYDIEGHTGQFPPLPFVKRALRQVLRGFAHMHSRNFVHTELSQFSRVEAAVSQPLPVPSVEEAMTRTFCISDMGSDITITEGFGWQRTERSVCRLVRNFQAPEVVLRAPLDEKVDIWLFGLLVFETVTADVLFKRPTEFELVAPIFPTCSYLWHMCALLGLGCGMDAFPTYLRGGVYARKYLNSDGVVTSDPPLPKQWHGSLRRVLDMKRPGLDSAEGDAIATILHRCLKLDPRERPSADELLEDPWWTK